MDIQEVKEYYGRRYKPILKALQNKKIDSFEIDKSCGVYLELNFKIGNTKYYINHGISNKFPYNLWYRKSYEGMKRYHFKSMKDMAEFIEKL